METDDLKDMLARSQETAAGLGGLDRTAYATDATGAVTVTVRADGSVVQARLHDQWRPRLGSADLTTAVAEAITSAQEKAAREWVESPGDAGRLSAVEPGAAVGSGEDPVDFARELLDLLAEIEQHLPGLAGVAQQAVDEEVRVEGPAGGITAVTRQGTLVSLEVNPQWMREAPRHRIEEELSAALVQALPGVQKQATRALRDVEPVGRLLGLLDDPAQLFARLGLTSNPGSGQAMTGNGEATTDVGYDSYGRGAR